MENEKTEIICYEVETLYRSGRKRSDIIPASSEDKMWEIYDKHHNKDLVSDSVIVDAWPQ